MELIVYINEVSLKDKDITKEYIEILEYLLSYGVKIYRSSKFKNIYNPIKDTNLKRRLNTIFTNQYKKQETHKWDNEDCINCEYGENEVYFFDEEGTVSIKKNSSIGEFISRKIIDEDNYYCFLLNFDNAIYRSCRPFDIYEQVYSEKFTDIMFFDKKEDIKKYCKEFIYTDLDFDKTPRDKQTMLRKQNLFIKVTNKGRPDGRAVYKNQIDCYFYYVDNLHKGEATHIEVFNDFRHIGEADINFGKIDKSKKDKNKSL